MKPQCTRLGDYGDYGDSVVSDACSISYEPTHIGRHQQGRCFRSSLFRHPRGRPLLKALIHRLGTSRSERSGVSTFRRASPTMRLHATNYSLGVALIMRAAAATPIAPTAAELGSCCTRTQVNMAEAPPHGRAEQSPLIPKSSLPDTFDWSDVDGRSYLLPSWNQHIPTYCGSCYAHAALSVVQDRIKVAKGGRTPDIMLARQSFINCGEAHGFGKGCGGGNAPDIYNFMHEVGLPDETCNAYVAQASDSCDAEAMCMNCMVLDDGSKECWPVERQTRYYVTEWGRLQGGEEAMMSEIFSRGPIGCALLSDEAFDFGYEGGVHTLKADGNITDINHDVEITGWGETSEGVKFWQARNSWGTFWGDQGFFKIERGVNLNFVETECYFPIPDFSDENLLADGRLTGSLHGLVPKNEKAAQEGTLFRQQLGQVDWAEVQTPPVLLKAGVFAERERRTVDGSAAATADVVDGGRFVGGGDGSRASGSGAGQGRGSSGGVLGGDWGWKAGVVAGVAGGVLASVSVAAISGAIKRGVRGDRGYEDISGA